MAKISRETLTRNDKRVDILVALFGDNEGNGWRDLSNDERLFILDNYGLKTEIFELLNTKDFSRTLTQRNKSWLNNLNNPSAPSAIDMLFYGREIWAFLESPLFLKYHHRTRLGVEEIDLAELKDGELYDLSSESFGYFIHCVNGDEQIAFLNLFEFWLAEKDKKSEISAKFDAWMIEEYGKEKTKAVNEITRFVISGALVTLSPHKLDKILEIINANEVEGLSNFSLGDK